MYSTQSDDQHVSFTVQAKDDPDYEFKYNINTLITVTRHKPVRQSSPQWEAPARFINNIIILHQQRGDNARGLQKGKRILGPVNIGRVHVGGDVGGGRPHVGHRLTPRRCGSPDGLGVIGGARSRGWRNNSRASLENWCSGELRSVTLDGKKKIVIFKTKL